MTEIAVLDRPVQVVRRKRGPSMTWRDGDALRWVGEQVGARLDVLGVLLGRLGGNDGPLSERTVRDQVARWQRMKLVRTVRFQSGMWVTLTRLGLERAGLEDLNPSPLSLHVIRHSHAINAVRLAYESDGARAAVSPWVSERLTWRERGTSTWHVPDGVVKVDDPGGCGRGFSIAAEIELTRKSKPWYRNDVFGNLRQGDYPITEVRYFTDSERLQAALIRDISAAGDALAGVSWSVHLLPQVPGVSYIDRRSYSTPVKFGGGRNG